ncbi:phosphoribosyltransferase family protein [Bradyrhizobium sp. B024]|uniref:Phosphoribosyltransferase domain-containing protein n=1 Tax=Bradyrhizobium diazoefficiens TaxID=1355477 RepID=A0A809Y496_9BRAD|nr:hypothetical protein [Bradyrhizobium japonicum]BCE33645.1 hypothetical protein XF2B_74140 [Bradyrhizobium diazoefficiens]BCE77251.1 hypothetical protein XF8B_73620 [Bradyrhizobium diazoefficiens]BCF20722.1 hypothetical protein XF13B_74130 [Bradyrhizobium diazoefficiens]
MGINISNDKYVALDNTHEKRVNTCVNDNPTSTKCGDVVVHHVFRRNKTGDADRDGNPLAYALKGMNGYRIMPMYRNMIWARAKEILVKCDELKGADYVMPMPSNYGFAAEFAQLVCDATGIPLLGCGFLRKKTIAEMLDQYGEVIPGDLSEARKKDYKRQLHTWRGMKPGQMVSMKEIDTKIRKYFDPFEIGDGVPDIKNQKILVVDDIVSSGSSMTSMTELLKAGTGCEIHRAVSFLSGL